MSTSVLTRSVRAPGDHGRSLEIAVREIDDKAKDAAGMGDRDLHFHDLRGTAATELYNAGLSERAIAAIMAWDEEHAARTIRRYVGCTAATKAIIAQLNQAKSRT